MHLPAQNMALGTHYSAESNSLKHTVILNQNSLVKWLRRAGQIIKSNLVEVAEAHPLYSRRLPLRQRGDKLHRGGLLLQHAQRQSAQHSIALIDEGLGRGASVDCDHFTSCTTEFHILHPCERACCMLHNRNPCAHTYVPEAV